jgi:hypothetical protein
MRQRRSPPSVDQVKRTDTNAQAAFVLVQIGDQLNSHQAYDRAAKTIDYLLQYHFQNNRLYHSRQNKKDGPVYNLPEDFFWLLAAAQEVQRVRPDQERQKELDLIRRLAAQWLSTGMNKGSPKRLPVDLLGLMAWVTVTNQDATFSQSMTSWALSGIRIGPSTQPDELVFALKAWEQHLHR